jgi:hypothetical protein
VVQVLFQRPPARTRRARFPGNGLSSDRLVGAVALTMNMDTDDRFGVPHYAYLPVVLVPGHLAPFALRPAFPDSVAGRDSCDYHEASVAIGLASRRRSRVRPCCTCRAERRWPTHLLKYPHWASLRAPEVLTDLIVGPGRFIDYGP